MLVAVTGGTGFVGSHAVAALRRAGHDVRMLVRTPAKVAPTLAPLGVDASEVEVVVADITDEPAVRAGLDGCDAVVHAASIYSNDPRLQDEMIATNDRGTRIVLESAIAASLDPIVHVSSVVALLHDGTVGEVLTPDTPPGDAPRDRAPYPASKAAQEVYVRELQAAGHPVVIVYPGGVNGPHDPYDGETVQVIRNAVRGLGTFMPTGGIPFVDVRDVAAVLAAVVEPGRGPRRYLAGGPYVPAAALVGMAAEAAGVRRPTVPIADAVARVAGRVGDAVAHRTGIDLGARSGPVWVAERRATTDDSATTADLGVTFRSAEESMRDTVAWLREAGRL